MVSRGKKKNYTEVREIAEVTEIESRLLPHKNF